MQQVANLYIREGARVQIPVLPPEFYVGVQDTLDLWCHEAPGEDRQGWGSSL